MKHELIKRISKIHAIKCCKSTEMNISIESFKTLTSLNERIIASKDDITWVGINQDIVNWAGTNPIATEQEINELLNNKHAL